MTQSLVPDPPSRTNGLRVEVEGCPARAISFSHSHEVCGNCEDIRISQSIGAPDVEQYTALVGIYYEHERIHGEYRSPYILALHLVHSARLERARSVPMMMHAHST